MRHLILGFGARNRRRLGRRHRSRPGTTGSSRKLAHRQRLGRSKYPARTAPVLPRGRHAGRAAQGQAGFLRRGPVQARPTSRSAIAARPCSFPSTRANRTRPRPAWAPASSSATSRSRRISQLVCRHAQNDLAHHDQHPRHAARGELHAAVRRRRPSTPPATCVTPASAECRTSDITLAEFKTLRARWTRSTPARAPRRSIRAAPPASAPTSTPAPRAATLLTHQESIELFKTAGRQDDPRAEVPVRDDAVQRLHAGGLRAEADRRVQGGGCRAARRLAAVVQQATTCSTG